MNFRPKYNIGDIVLLHDSKEVKTIKYVKVYYTSYVDRISEYRIVYEFTDATCYDEICIERLLSPPKISLLDLMKG